MQTLSFLWTGIVIYVAANLVGCSREDNFSLTIQDFGFEERRDVYFPTNSPKTIAEMAPGDVIVAVNGYPLTKRAYDDLMMLRFQGIMLKKDMNNLAAEQMMDEYRVRYVKNFQGQRMMMDEAFRTGIASTNEIIDEVVTRLKNDAKRRKMTVERSLAPFKDKRKYVLQEMFTAIVMDKLIAAKIPPKLEVDPSFVAAVQEQITSDNAAIASTNALLSTLLKNWKQQIITNKLDFTEVAMKFSENPDDQGIWGSFEEGDMDDPKVEAAVFALPEGAISDVLEDFNGYHLVKVLSVTPPKTNEQGRIITKEVRKLSHIYFEKIPESIRMDDVKMTADLKAQMQMQSVNEFITDLSTNGTTRIEFPNGTELFAP